MTAAGVVAADFPEGMRACDSHEVSQLNELKIDINALTFTAHYRLAGDIIMSEQMPIIGGWAGGVEETAIVDGSIDLVINVPREYDQQGRPDGYMIRRMAIDSGVPLLQLAELQENVASRMAIYLEADGVDAMDDTVPGRISDRERPGAGSVTAVFGSIVMTVSPVKSSESEPSSSSEETLPFRARTSARYIGPMSRPVDATIRTNAMARIG